MLTLKCSCCGFEQTINKKIDKKVVKLTHNRGLLCGRNSCKRDESLNFAEVIEESGVYGNWKVIRDMTKSEREGFYRSWLNGIILLRESDPKNTEIREADLLAIAGAEYDAKNARKYVGKVLKLASDISNLKGKKNLTLVDEEGYVEVSVGENGLINNSILETEDFYAYLLSTIEKNSHGLNIRQFIAKDGKNDICKVYGVNISNGDIHYISAKDLEWTYSFNPFTGESLPKEKNTYYSQLG